MWPPHGAFSSAYCDESHTVQSSHSMLPVSVSLAYLLFGHVTQKPGLLPSGPSPQPAGYFPCVHVVHGAHTASRLGLPPILHVVEACSLCAMHTLHGVHVPVSVSVSRAHVDVAKELAAH